jgi:hypothetical protein
MVGQTAIRYHAQYSQEEGFAMRLHINRQSRAGNCRTLGLLIGAIRGNTRKPGDSAAGDAMPRSNR